MQRAMIVLALMALPTMAMSAPTAMFAPRDAVDPASKAALAESVRLIEDDRYCEALPFLEDLAVDLPDNADVFNLLGYVYRKMDDLEVSAAHYARALSIDPNHLATLEYQGRLFLKQGDLGKAQDNLARLETLCGACEEREALKAAIDASLTQ
ncbi:MAG: tetratricopeptide repeat protein [Pseudomonadota bacterium]